MKPIHLILSKPFEKIGSCQSRFWGNPDLPHGMDYPTYVDDEGDDYPYYFICQINLEQLAPYDTDGRLPHKGLLSFFAKIDHYMGYFGADGIGGCISDPEDVKVLFFPECSDDDFREVVLVDDEDKPTAPEEMEIRFAHTVERYADDHALFALPTHREWETWDSPCEDWEILLQIDSFMGMDFNLNFMDCGVLDFLISDEALRRLDFSDVRGIVLST